MEELRIRDYSKTGDGSVFMIDKKRNGVLEEGVRLTRDELLKVFDFCRATFGERTNEDVREALLKGRPADDAVSLLIDEVRRPDSEEELEPER